jgi:phosphate transport system substrate-binding protein
MGAVALAYNLPGQVELKFTPEVVTQILTGRIRRWNDPQIRNINPNMPALDLPIEVVRRSDESGTTYILSEYLAKVSPLWKETMGTGKALTWNVGQGAKGNQGVAGMISQTLGSIGYVELTYALANNMKTVALMNRAGNFVAPNTQAVSLAGAMEIPDDTNISLTDSSAPSGYPISGFTWVVVYKEQDYANRSSQRAQELVKLLWWVIHEGQAFAKPLHYAPLSGEAQRAAENLLKSINFGGHRLADW